MTQPKAAQAAGTELLRAIQDQDHNAFQKLAWVGGSGTAANPYHLGNATLTVSTNAAPTTSYVASALLNG